MVKRAFRLVGALELYGLLFVGVALDELRHKLGWAHPTRAVGPEVWDGYE